ncbi:hypothetical protein, partial [Photobacterium sanctipauli]
YAQLEYCLGLAWDYFVRPEESLRPMTKKRIVKVTFDYGWNRSINHLVKNIFSYQLEQKNKKDERDILDDSIRDSFQILRHWFQYKIPKWLIVIHEIQKFVCLEKGIRPGNYLYYASLIENDFIPDNLTILAEIGVPKSAIDKLQKHISTKVNQDLILSEIRERKLYSLPSLLDYEKNKILENL